MWEFPWLWTLNEWVRPLSKGFKWNNNMDSLSLSPSFSLSEDLSLPPTDYHRTATRTQVPEAIGCHHTRCNIPWTEFQIESQLNRPQVRLCGAGAGLGFSLGALKMKEDEGGFWGLRSLHSSASALICWTTPDYNRGEETCHHTHSTAHSPITPQRKHSSLETTPCSGFW